MHIEIFKNYKYDNTYDYIKTFSNIQEQESYFNSLSSVRVNDTHYLKDYESFIVDYSYDYLLINGYNYIRFINENKYIYAFIVRKEYEGEERTRLTYEIDVIQTFMFDFTIKNSFIERKVCSIGEIADFDEGLDLGEHEIKSDTNMITKEYDYFAMFNGIKEQSIVFDAYGKFQNCIEVPYVSAKPMTLIDNIQYPLYFMPLRATQSDYADVRVVPVNPDIPITGGVVGSARKLLGKPYVWGGNYPPLGQSLGTDCSGLCMWAFNDQGLLSSVGIQGRWITDTMYAKANNIPSPADAYAGDVLFSNFNNNGIPQHVALISNINIERITIIEAQGDGIPILERTLDYNANIHKIGRL